MLTLRKLLEIGDIEEAEIILNNKMLLVGGRSTLEGQRLYTALKDYGDYEVAQYRASNGYGRPEIVIKEQKRRNEI